MNDEDTIEIDDHNQWRNDPETELQRDFSEYLGMNVPPNATKRKATDLITRVLGRRSIGNRLAGIASGTLALIAAEDVVDAHSLENANASG